MGFDKSILFGSSSGGILSFQFAHDFPEMVDRLISHQAPTITLLPDASKMFEWGLHLEEVYKTHGLDQVNTEFEAELIGFDDEGIPKTVPPEPSNVRNLWDNEFSVVMGYVPNLWRLKENKIRIGVMRGIRCKDAFSARATVEQAKILECPSATVPGHLQGFEVETDEFLPYLLDMLDKLRKNHG